MIEKSELRGMKILYAPKQFFSTWRKNSVVVEELRPDRIGANRFIVLIAVGIAVIVVTGVWWALVSISKPTINVWCPRTIQPGRPIINNAIGIESL